ncbi:Wzz/FepE/Etk N-terminal domain-containing protein [Sphingomonas sp. NY01]|uniref:Wzz/FepE/Etk N-terminal domain-containing protein n=1 Tax=Sphingomonas sp. NY01 TaxID=2968057 RepID=UPI00315D86A9
MFSSDMAAALKARWKLIVAVLIATLVLAGIWLTTVQRTYVATASLLFDDRGPNPALQDNPQQQDDRSMLGTQADIIRSDAVARRVARNERLVRNPELRTRWLEEGKGEGSFENWIVTDLLAHLEVAPGKDTNVLAVRFRASDPTFAARMANSFARNFVTMRLQISTDTAKQYATWFQSRTDEVRRNLEAAQGKVTDFQRSHGLIDGNVLALESDRLNALSGQLANAESSAADLRSRAGSRVSESPDVQQTAVVGMLRQQIAANDAKVSQLAATHGDSHPLLVAARSELEVLRARLASETSAASQSVRVASSAAATREAQLSGLVAQQRARMMQMTGYQSQLEALQNDVATAQKAYDNVTQRLNLMRLQSGLPTTNAQQIDRATAPLLPASPNVPLLLLFATLGGLALGVIAAMLAEWSRPLVRTAGGLIDATGVPVVGSFNFAPFRHGRAHAVGGM